MPWFDHGLDASRFINVVNDFAFKFPEFDWPKWAETADGRILRNDPTAVANANAHQLAKLSIAIVRADKFSEGTLAQAFESGLIRAITNRAAAIQ